MSATLTRNGKFTSLADIIGDLGGVPANRIRAYPPPGLATEADVLRLAEQEGRLYELVDGTLVEKAMGWGEVKIEAWLYGEIHDYLKEHRIGEVYPGTGFIRLLKGVVRAPDLTFYLSANTTTDEEDRKHPITRSVPDLAVEVLSQSNTVKEMDRKRKEFFAKGTSLIWQINPRKRTVEVYISLKDCRVLTPADTLDGGTLLPGFSVSVKSLLDRESKSGHGRK
jgi:Uma2 family endonuclease